MVRDNRQSKSKLDKTPRPPITFADHTVGQHSAPQDADGWSTVETKEDKKNQRLRKFANKKIPAPPPFPPTPDDLNRLHLRDDRHQFTPALEFARINTRDPIFSATSDVLRLHNASSFAHFANPVSIFTLERPSWHDFILGRGTRQYAIGREGQDHFIAKVPLFISNHKVMVRNGVESLDFADWISTLPYTAGPDVLGEAGYRLLFQWHKARRAQKQCKPLDANVMDIILLKYIGEVRNVQNDQDLSITHSHDFHLNSSESVRAWQGGAQILPHAIPSVDWRLLCVNKATYERVQLLTRLHTIKSFDIPMTLSQVLLGNSTHFIDCLTRVQLSFTDLDYFKFFQVALPDCFLPPTPTNGNYQASILRNIPNLVYLELFFHSPVDQVRSNQIPWDLSHLETVQFGGGVFKRVVPYQCRRAIVDYILCFAYKSIHHILKVNITGYVKTTTRDYLLKFLQDKRNQVAHSEMVEERIKGVKKQPFTDFTPICTCKLPCFYDAFNIGLKGPLEYWSPIERMQVQRRNYMIHAEALSKYVLDYDDDLDTSGMTEDFLAMRTYWL